MLVERLVESELAATDWRDVGHRPGHDYRIGAIEWRHCAQRHHLCRYGVGLSDPGGRRRPAATAAATVAVFVLGNAFVAERRCCRWAVDRRDRDHCRLRVAGIIRCILADICVITVRNWFSITSL
jgi:hypothetical protein